MFAGHVGVALAIGHAERRVNVGVFVAAALLLDALLWLFVLLGWESLTLPPDFAATHQPVFVFPWSHGLLAALSWSALAGVVATPVLSRRAARLVAAAVFSHWAVDALVHRPEMPLAGGASAGVGLALWDHMAAALVLEGALVAAGAWLFLHGSDLGRGRTRALAALCLLLFAFTALGMTVAPPPPSAQAMAATSLATLVAVCAAFAWLGARPSRAAPATPG